MSGMNNAAGRGVYGIITFSVFMGSILLLLQFNARAALAIALATVATATVAPEYLQVNHTTGDPPPSGAVEHVQTVVLSGGRDAVGESQPDDCPTIMIGTATPGGDHTNGWAEIPIVAGFDLRRLVVDQDANATIMYYIENTKDFSQVKRVVITIAGLWRNGWKYANNMRNSLLCAAGRETIDADMNQILIAAPQWLNEEDVAVGATVPNDIYFHNNIYQRGAAAVGPGEVHISSYEAMDQLVNIFWNKDIFPALESIVIASHLHNLTQLYAMLRPTQPQDPQITFGIMNPGSYAWPLPSRPAQSEECSETYDDWPYGIGPGDPDPFSAYVRDEALANRIAIEERYFNKKIFYGFGLEGHGLGDSHCEAEWQGSTHLERVQNFQRMLDGLPGGMPAGHYRLH
ncbi:uncharacterized protein BDV17DRAFT_289916 [Aspergillus undulatus]|uniref:uncharacterized protein n=1 Tax=Aspergillus undulatus TaxID=1810928 RepID=UPI003CCE20DB